MNRRYPDRPIVGVLAVVLRGERALVVRRAHPPLAGRWGFPGGVLELGETVAEGAMRELLEETGVVAEPAGVLTVIDTIDRDPRGPGALPLHADRGARQVADRARASPATTPTRSPGSATPKSSKAAYLTAPALLPLIDLALAGEG